METPNGLEERIAWLEGLIEIVRAQASSAGAFYQTMQLDGNPQSPQRPALNFANHLDPTRIIATGQFNAADDSTNSATDFQLLTLYLCTEHSGGGSVPIQGQVSVRVDTTVGPTTVAQGITTDNVWNGCRMRVKDSTGHAGTNHITVTFAAGMTVENPTSLGTYGATATIATNGAGYEWEWNETTTQWEVV